MKPIARLLGAIAPILAFTRWADAQVDLRIIDLPDIVHNGSVGGVEGYSVGFTLCNVGSVPAAWQSGTNQHPIQSWGLFRISGGRIEQLGLSWIKHGNFAASTPSCGTCDTNINGARLGPGCRDTYDASYNSFQYGLGPRSDINPSAGTFPYPPTIGYTLSGNATYKHCQIADADLVGQPAGTIFLAEGLIVHPQDAAAGNASNNISYRLVNITTPSLNAAMTGATVQGSPAIQAWRDHGLGLNQADPSIVVTPVDVPGDGRIWVGSRATDLGSGNWQYEYAIENQSSHRAVGGIVIPVASTVTLGAIGFHDVAYHSGEPIDGADWPGQYDAAVQGVRWATATFATNPSANAIRWGTLYNVRFVAHAPPVAGAVSLDLFRPGMPAALSASALVPAAPRCLTDFNGDGQLSVQDIFDFLNAWFGSDPRADVNGGGLSVQDIFDFLGAWFVGCP